jgi:hypothetical protein
MLDAGYSKMETGFRKGYAETMVLNKGVKHCRF